MESIDSQAKRIRERRTANALTQTELADRLGVNQTTISLWERGKAKPNGEQLKKLGNILGSLDLSAEGIIEEESQTPLSAWLQRSLSERKMTVAELAAQSGLALATVYNVQAGRARSPHPKTVAALEKALGIPFESKQETIEASEIAGIGQLIDFNPYDQNDIPTKAGVYVLYDISQRPIYVGKAKKISNRLAFHGDRFWFKRPLVETGAYIEIPDAKLRHQIETVLIQFLKNNAVINKQNVVRDEE